MTFTTPLWLLALIPWLILAAWLFRGKPVEVQVPFVMLWREVATQRPGRKPRQLPAAFVGATLLALLIGVIAAAGPAWRVNQRTPRVSVADPSPPHPPAESVSIAEISARQTPVPQVMVRLEQHVRGEHAIRVRVRSGAAVGEQALTLSTTNPTPVVFVDLPGLGSTIEAQLVTGGDLPPADPARLARQSVPRRIVPTVPLRSALDKLLTLYARQHPPGDSSQRLIITDWRHPPQDDQAAVVLGWTDAGAPTASSQPRPSVIDHPLTQFVAWDGLPIEVASSLPPPGFEPLVRVGQRVALAIRQQPARQVWIGFDVDAWAARPAFVVFWSNVLGWADGEEEWRAVNAPPVHVASAALAQAVDAKRDFPQFKPVPVPWVIGALALLVAAAFLWRRKQRPAEPGVP